MTKVSPEVMHETIRTSHVTEIKCFSELIVIQGTAALMKQIAASFLKSK